MCLDYPQEGSGSRDSDLGIGFRALGLRKFGSKGPESSQPESPIALN